MLLFFSAKSLFFMVCQLLIIIPKNRGNGTESKSDKKIRDERQRFRGSAGRGNVNWKNKRHRNRFLSQEVALGNNPYQLVRKPTARRKERMIGCRGRSNLLLNREFGRLIDLFPCSKGPIYEVLHSYGCNGSYRHQMHRCVRLTAMVGDERRTWQTNRYGLSYCTGFGLAALLLSIKKKASDILITSYKEDKKMSEITTFSFLGNHLPLHSFPGKAILPFSINLPPGLSASFSNSILLPQSNFVQPLPLLSFGQTKSSFFSLYPPPSVYQPTRNQKA